MKAMAKAKPFERVLASDSSFLTEEYAPGVSVLLARVAAALYGSDGKEREKLDLDLIPFVGVRDLRNVASRVGETMEHEALAEMIDQTTGEFVVLLDGSLLAREFTAVLSLGRIPSSLVARYIDAISNLMTSCWERGIQVVGISKDSRAYHLRSFLISDLFEKEKDRLSHILPETDMTRITSAWGSLETGPAKALSSLSELNERHDGRLRRLMQIASEMRRHKSDFSVIMRHLKKEGMSKPLMVGPYTTDSKATFASLSSNPDRLARRAARDSEDPERTAERIRTSIDQIRELPTIATFCAVLSPRDEPIRIDVPAWTFGLDFKIPDLEGVNSLDPYDLEMNGFRRIMATLIKGYASSEIHNIWLADVDRTVKLRRNTFLEVYEPMIWRELEWMELHTRGERRVTII